MAAWKTAKKVLKRAEKFIDRVILILDRLRWDERGRGNFVILSSSCCNWALSSSIEGSHVSSVRQYGSRHHQFPFSTFRHILFLFHEYVQGDTVLRVTPFDISVTKCERGQSKNRAAEQKNRQKNSTPRKKPKQISGRYYEENFFFTRGNRLSFFSLLTQNEADIRDELSK